MKKGLFLFLIAIFFLLSACTIKPVNRNSTESGQNDNTKDNEEEKKDNKESDEVKKNEDDKESDEVKKNEERKKVYIESLKKLYSDGIKPNGEKVMEYSENELGNNFAITDIDKDGVVELIIDWNESITAGMWGAIYQYDLDKKEYVEQGISLSNMEFYDNGMIVIPWRHNQTSGEMWPYYSYKYNKDTDKYEHALTAAQWSKKINSTDFPSDVDKENAGVVYLINETKEDISASKPISKTEYDKVYNKYFADANKLDVEFYDISQSGIDKYLSTKN